jgi:hypothetical protein
MMSQEDKNNFTYNVIATLVSMLGESIPVKAITEYLSDYSKISLLAKNTGYEPLRLLLMKGEDHYKEMIVIPREECTKLLEIGYSINNHQIEIKFGYSFHSVSAYFSVDNGFTKIRLLNGEPKTQLLIKITSEIKRLYISAEDETYEKGSEFIYQANSSINADNIPDIKLSYKDVLHAGNMCVGHQQELSELAVKLEYKYYIWSGRVFYSDVSSRKDTGLLASEVK